MMVLVDLPSIEPVTKYLEDNFDKSSLLATHILSAPHSKLSVRALVPNGTSLDRALEFDRGGLNEMDAASTWLTDRVRNQCRSEGGGTFLVEDAWIEIGDIPQVRSKVHVPLFAFDHSTYYWADCAGLTNTAVGDVLKAAASFQIIAAFTLFKLASDKVPNKSTIDEKIFESLVSHVKEFYLRAYDQESFVVLGMT